MMFIQSKQQRIGTLITVMMMTFATLLTSLPAVAASEETKRHAQLVEGAKKEGKVIVYGSMPVNEAMPLAKKFEGKYPFIKAEYVRLPAMVNLNRILAEEKSGKYTADVTVLKLSLLIFLKSKGLLAKYDSPEHSFFSANVKDPERYWTTFYLTHYIVGYNTHLVKPQEVPRNYEGLLNPKWKRNVGIERDGHDWFTGLMEAMGKEKGMSYMQKLLKQQPGIRSGTAILRQLLIAGEFAFVIQSVNEIEYVKKSGAPVDWAKFDFPSPTSLTSAAVLAKAPHSNAARLYYDFLLSKDAAEYLASPVLNRVPARGGIKPQWMPSDFKFLPLSEALLSDVQEKNMKEYDRLLTTIK